jgi:hypothetical protein
VKDSELWSRFSRSVVLVIADFRREMDAVRALQNAGARVEVAGLGGDDERRELSALGVDADGVSESRDAVLEAALDRLGAADAVLFGAGGWQAERKELFDAERELAIADGRSLKPFVATGQGRGQ